MQILRGIGSRLLVVLVSSLLIVLFTGCGQKTFDSESQLLEFLLDEANGYSQYKTVNGVEFSLVYRPTDLLIKQEIGDRDIEKGELKKLKEKYRKYMYFNLGMSKNKQELLSAAPRNLNEFGIMVNQLVFGMRDKVHLYTQTKDTLGMVDFLYPRMYGVGSETTIMFVYAREIEKLGTKAMYFTVEDLGLQTGEVKFKIETNKINNEPKLDLKL